MSILRKSLKSNKMTDKKTKETRTQELISATYATAQDPHGLLHFTAVEIWSKYIWAIIKLEDILASEFLKKLLSVC